MFGIEEVAKKDGYTTVLASSSYDENIIINELEKLSNFVDGIIICTNIVSNKIIQKVLDKNVPIVAIDIKIEDGIIPSVEVNNYNSVMTGIQYLIDAGHKDIYYLSEPLSLGVTIDRFNAYKDCLKANDIKIKNNNIILDKGLEINKTQMGYEIVKKLLKNMKMETAIFATSDLIIIGAMQAVIEKGYKIPEDVSFLGNENIFLSEFTNPPLSTIKHPKKEMGRVAMKLLLDLISGKELKEKRIFLDTNLIIRSTVKII
jgi:DNA-binding LacI/PurR family transcriptional regulator